MRVLEGVCMLLGCFLGAGFVSGREVASYFSRFGCMSILAIIVCVILMFLLMLFFLFLSKTKHKGFYFVDSYFGGVSGGIRLLISVSVLIVISSMFAGTMSLAETFGVNKILFMLFTILFAFLIVMGNVKSLANINIILIPLLILILFWVCLEPISFDFFTSNSASAIISGGNYVFINIMSIGLFLLEIGGEYNRKEKVLISAITTFVIAIMLVLVNNAILTNKCIDDTFPVLSLITNSRTLYVILQSAIYFGLFTTLISNVFVLSNYVNVYLKNYKISVILSLVSGVLLSFIGFKFIVGYVYWIIGLIGFVVVVWVGIKEIWHKRVVILQKKE